MKFIQKLRSFFNFSQPNATQPQAIQLGQTADGNELPVGDLQLSPSLNLPMTTEFTYRQTEFGVIASIVDLGYIVSLPNEESGFVHRSEVCWPGQRIRYEIGDKVKVMIIGFKPGRGLTLSIRRGKNDEIFKDFFVKYGVNSKFTGHIKAVKDYGVFVTVSPGVEGLLHISAIPNKTDYNRSSVGQPVDVVIVGIDPERRRLQLNLLQQN